MVSVKIGTRFIQRRPNIYSTVSAARKLVL